jgi:hypothetical protein
MVRLALRDYRRVFFGPFFAPPGISEDPNSLTPAGALPFEYDFAQAWGMLTPILSQLRVELDATRSGHLSYLVTEFGKPFTANGFGNWFRKRCDEAGLPHCSAHGLRKAGATIAANNRATEHQLMAIYGWESPKQAAHYTRQANRKKLAGDAMHLLVPGTEEQKIAATVPLLSAESGGGTIKEQK